MVTLRRDIAAQSSNGGQALTNYDVFMQEKKQSFEKRNVNREKGIKSYQEYLLEQLNRPKTDSANSVLSQEQYTNRYLKPLNENSRPSTKKRESKSLSKFGKIILATYVLITIALASIILVTNTDKQQVVKASSGVAQEVTK